MSASETIECVYEGSVFKSMENVKLEEGTKLNIKIENYNAFFDTKFSNSTI